MVESSDKTKCLELALPSLQFPEDQGTENFHLLWEKKNMEIDPFQFDTRTVQNQIISPTWKQNDGKSYICWISACPVAAKGSGVLLK